MTDELPNEALEVARAVLAKSTGYCSATPRPAEIVLRAWAEGLSGITRSEALGAVQRHYAATSACVSVADIRGLVSAGRAERADRERTRLMIEAPRPADHVREVGMAKIRDVFDEIGIRPSPVWPDRRCGHCGARPHTACVNTATGNEMQTVHASRLDEAS